MMMMKRRRKQLELSGNDSCRDRAKRYSLFVGLLLIWVLIPGCSVKEMGTTVKYSIKGEHFLQVDDPAKGEESFRREVETNPENPFSNYYYGRLLLRSDKAKAALSYLQKASRLDPDNADYLFWTGVAHGSLKQIRQERSCYEQALKRDGDHVQSLTALGHYYLRKKKYTKALELYSKALDIWPKSPSALYNRALVLSRLGRTPEEQLAWHEYLAVNDSGGLARNAVDHLNTLNDFSYRNYPIGPRLVTVEKVRFEPFSAELARDARPALEMIGAAADNLKSGVLQVVVYQQNNVELARARAQSIRTFLRSEYPELKGDRIGISWFGEPQRDRKKKWRIEESVDFFLVNN